MSTEVYLKGLDLSQLIFARDCANKLISQKNEEKRRVVWCLEDDVSTIMTFKEDDYINAAKTLLKNAEENFKSKNIVINPMHFELHLVCRIVPESEYDSWVNNA
jgi:hypothetical protein